jgi:hypothetical protein
MEKLLRWFSFACFFGALMVACQPYREKLLPENPLPTANLDESLLKPGGELEMVKKQKALLGSAVRVLDQGHQIFSETWKIIFAETNSVPPSMMKQVGEKLQSQLAQTPKVCPEDHLELQMNKVEAGQAVHARLISVKCQGTTAILKEIGSLYWHDSDKRLFALTVMPTNVPEAFGDSLALLNRKAICYFSYADNGRLEKMSCQNLGQGLSKTSHIEFKKFVFDVTKEKQLLVDADRYNDLLKRGLCTSKNPCIRLEVPMDGKVKLVEDRRMGVSPELKKPPVPTIVAPETRGQNENQEKRENSPQGGEFIPEGVAPKSESREPGAGVPAAGDQPADLQPEIL